MTDEPAGLENAWRRNYWARVSSRSLITWLHIWRCQQILATWSWRFVERFQTPSVSSQECPDYKLSCGSLNLWISVRQQTGPPTPAMLWQSATSLTHLFLRRWNISTPWHLLMSWSCCRATSDSDCKLRHVHAYVVLLISLRELAYFVVLLIRLQLLLWSLSSHVAHLRTSKSSFLSSVMQTENGTNHRSSILCLSG